MTKPLGVAEFTHLEKLLLELNGSLPACEELEVELGTAVPKTTRRRAKRHKFRPRAVMKV